MAIKLEKFKSLRLVPILFISVGLSACSQEQNVQIDNAEVSQLDPSLIVITNARFLDGSGTSIDSGSMVVRDGIIESINQNMVLIPNATTIDAQGMTVMPGFIDGHRHIIQGDPTVWMSEMSAASMYRFVESGFTTIFSAGDPEVEILELRRRLADSEIVGPRLLAAARAPLATSRAQRSPDDPARTDVSRPPHRPTEAAIPIADEDTRSRVSNIAASGFDAIKTVMLTTPDGPEKDTLSLITAESNRHNLFTVTHAVTVEDTLAAVESGGVFSLVHTPHIGQLTLEQAQLIAQSGIPMVSTLGIFVPFFDENNLPIFRDEHPYPWDTLSSAGQGPVNARLLWEAGVVYGFGTDTRYDPKLTLEHELKSLHLVFSEQDIIKIMTINSAINLGLEDSIGSLEQGKKADLVFLDGNPLEDIYDLLNVKMVIRDGLILVDNM